MCRRLPRSMSDAVDTRSVRRLPAAARGIRSAARESMTPASAVLLAVSGAATGPVLLAIVDWVRGGETAPAAVLAGAGVVIVLLIVFGSMRSRCGCRISQIERDMLRAAIRARGVELPDEGLRHVAAVVRCEEVRALLALSLFWIPFLGGFIAVATLASGFPPSGTTLFGPVIIAAIGVMRLGATQLLLEVPRLEAFGANTQEGRS